MADVLPGVAGDVDRVLRLILHDLGTTGAPVPVVSTSDWQSWPGAVSLMLTAPDGSGMGVWVDPAALEMEQVAMLAGQVQEWVVEELARTRRATNWPRCPEHPSNHPLDPRVERGLAVWACPRSGAIVTQVGQLEHRH